MKAKQLFYFKDRQGDLIVELEIFMSRIDYDEILIRADLTKAA